LITPIARLNLASGALHPLAPTHFEEINLSNVPVIAIVDDDESFRQAAVRLIRSLGYATAAFASAEAFLHSDRGHDVDCLITDVQMPGMTGIQLQSQLIGQGRKLPIIFVTAFPEMKPRERALAAGAVGFLDKPFSDEKLITCLNQALGARSV
jgi:FixJ family two-component response regulator